MRFAAILGRGDGRVHGQDAGDAIDLQEIVVKLAQRFQIFGAERLVRFGNDLQVGLAVGKPLVEQVELHEGRIVGAEDLADVARIAVMSRTIDRNWRDQRNEKKAQPRVTKRNEPELLNSETSRHRHSSFTPSAPWKAWSRETAAIVGWDL
ncbi:MAG: hypothetical protein A49_13850 [Methyloceanibacter sp.]|nr:MAG: hypothetical protein A49_13850 [Methyloceanibacter sp.]